mmetsp:Transcript_18549/g.25794  ORF Transcript_18549/g.25794 Transcript_18549/m.25794 type:complete len:80 (-) Transcript_18549:600-839(-)
MRHRTNYTVGGEVGAGAGAGAGLELLSPVLASHASLWVQTKITIIMVRITKMVRTRMIVIFTFLQHIIRFRAVDVCWKR